MCSLTRTCSLTRATNACAGTFFPVECVLLLERVLLHVQRTRAQPCQRAYDDVT
jgi:hypothetical protein